LAIKKKIIFFGGGKIKFENVFFAIECIEHKTVDYGSFANGLVTEKDQLIFGNGRHDRTLGIRRVLHLN